MRNGYKLIRIHGVKSYVLQVVCEVQMRMMLHCVYITGPRVSSNGKRAAEKTPTFHKSKLMKITVKSGHISKKQKREKILEVR